MHTATCSPRTAGPPMKIILTSSSIGIEWTVREVPTPQSWARASRCLVLSSRECVRRVWSFPDSWRSLDADELLRLGRAD